MKNNDTNQKSTNDVEAIKKDLKDIANRIKKFDTGTLKILYEDSEELFSEISEVKNKVLDSSKSNIKEMMCSCIGKNPMTSALCYMGLGAALTIVLKKMV